MKWICVSLNFLRGDLHRFYHFKWKLLHSQIYGFLLLVNGLIVTIELSVTLYFLQKGTIHYEKYCGPWITLNYSLFQLSIFLITWTSIERYLFIYHEILMNRHFILLHYFPIGFLSFYCPALYVGIVLLHTCQTNYDVRLYICGGPCYSLEQTLGLLDWVGNGICMEMLTLIINLLLIIRHLLQQHQMKRMILTVDRRQRRVNQNFLLVRIFIFFFDFL